MFQKIVVSLRRLFSYEKWVDLIVRFGLPTFLW